MRPRECLQKWKELLGSAFSVTRIIIGEEGLRALDSADGHAPFLVMRAFAFCAPLCASSSRFPRSPPRSDRPSVIESCLYQLQRSLHTQMLRAELVWRKRVGVELRNYSTSPVFQRRCTHTSSSIGTNSTTYGSIERHSHRLHGQGGGGRKQRESLG